MFPVGLVPIIPTRFKKKKKKKDITHNMEISIKGLHRIFFLGGENNK
jgi:hypothetical protein